MSTHPAPSEDDIAFLRRADAVLRNATFGPLAASTASEYRKVAARLVKAAQAAGRRWTGIEGLTDARGYHYEQRAAWTRLVHYEVAAALDDLRSGRCASREAIARLREWVPQAEAYPPRPVSYTHLTLPTIYSV